MRKTLLFVSLFLAIKSLSADGLESSAYDKAYETYKNGDATKALSLFEMLCDGNNFVACFSAGVLYSGEAGVQKDMQKMQELYKKACENGIAGACNNLAYELENMNASENSMGNNPENVNPPSNTKDNPSSTNLNAKQDSTLNASSSNPEAKDQNTQIIDYYQKACNSGNPNACDNLGLIYNNAQLGVQKDDLKAFTYYKQGCELGFQGACYHLGNMLYYGLGSTKDILQAQNYFEQACSANIANACLNAGILFENGELGNPNKTKASELYQKACKLGNQKACSYGS